MNKTVVILTRQGSPYGRQVINYALNAELNLQAVMLQQWGIKQKFSKFRSYQKKYWAATTIFSKLAELIDHRFIDQSQDLPNLEEDTLINNDIDFHIVPSLNGRQMQAKLDEIKPDIILLGGVGVVSEKIIQCAQLGVLNAHPGLVPDYRGSYVIRWALLAGDPVGITVHLVDAGIDTGPVLMTSHLTLPQTVSIVAIENFVDQQRAKLLADTAKQYLQEEIIPAQQKADQDGKPFSVMPPRELLKTYTKLRQAQKYANRFAL